jgi:energy-coupling factor transporter ATP-binding protein EcfA2
MRKFEVVGTEIAAYLDEPLQKLTRLISPWRGSRFVVCGTSGSGKSRAIKHANRLLPADKQIAESREIVGKTDAARAKEIMQDKDLEYEASEHIAFAVYSRDLGTALELAGVKVFWLDGGITTTQ